MFLALIIVIFILIIYNRKISGSGDSNVIFIFHRDLRIEDNTALNYASDQGNVVPVFIFDDRQLSNNEYKSDRAVSFMKKSLDELEQNIAEQGGQLIYLHNDGLEKLLDETRATHIFFNKDYTPFAKKRDSMKFKGIKVESYHDLLLLDEHHGYKKFTPFYNSIKSHKVRKPRTAKIKFSNFRSKTDPRQIQYIDSVVNGGRKEALELASKFNYKDYSDKRDRLDFETSHMSAHLKFGTISIRELYYITKDESYRRQLWWRDFYYGVANNDKNLLNGPYYNKYKNTWSEKLTQKDKKLFEAWKSGATGFPLIDSAMDQLNNSGFMHGRARLLVADFLVKLLKIDWRRGEKYFATKLVDYDPIINNYNWQWVAGTAPFSQPYFRVFNPLLVKKYDPEEKYINKWLPYSNPPDKIIDYEKERNEYKTWIKGGGESFLILPNQLFKDTKLLENYSNIILYEHPKYFTMFDYHKQKLVLHRASMKYYENYLRSKGIEVEYVEFDEKLDLDFDMYDPIDNTLRQEIQGDIFESPMFLLDTKDLEEYNGSLSHNASFYPWVKDKLNIFIDGIYDKENRDPFPENIKDIVVENNENEYVKEAKKYISKKFPDNMGSIDNFIWPVTHKESSYWLKDFVKNKFKLFGNYQDAVREDINFGYHSMLSSSLNIGLLTPKQVLNSVQKTKNIPINSYEGFIRQLVGWREFCRYLYHFDIIIPSNYFGFKNKLSDKWTPGKGVNLTHIDPILNKIYKYAWSHHIERLMYLSNIMLLCEIHPDQVYDYFMKTHIDSYEWVMVPNIYGMATYADGGKMMSKPYYSSASYPEKMGATLDEHSKEIHNALFRRFLHKNSSKLKDYRSRQWVRLKPTKKQLKIADDFIRFVKK